MIIEIKDGGQLERVGETKILSEIKIFFGETKIEFWINDSSLSYLNLDEALKIRNALNIAIKDCCQI